MDATIMKRLSRVIELQGRHIEISAKQEEMIGDLINAAITQRMANPGGTNETPVNMLEAPK